MSTVSATQTTTPGPGPASRRTTVLVVLAAISIVAVPLILSEGHREIARWHQADAEEKQLDGDLPGAIESLDKALQWNDDSVIYLRRASVRLDQGDVRGCSEDCEVVIRRTQAGPYLTLRNAFDLRSRAHLEAGEYAQAVDDRKKIGELLEKQPRLMKRSSYLNSLAYYRALGGIELQQAEQDSSKAVELLGDDQQRNDALLRCYLEADWADAAFVLNEVTSDLQQRFTKELRASTSRIYEEVGQHFPPSASSPLLTERMAETHLESAERLRLLQLRQVDSQHDDHMTGGESEQPDAALRAAMNRLPELQKARQLLAELSASLDTRGFIAWKLARRDATQADTNRTRLASARDDLDRAVIAMEVALQATRTYLAKHEHELLDTRWEQVELKSMERSAAVIRYHRGLLYQSLGKSLRAARDFVRVKELGYEPDEQLY